FHVSGVHTSIAMSESALGVAFTTTRQNAGNDFQKVGSPAIQGERPAGGGKPPPGAGAAETALAAPRASAPRALHASRPGRAASPPPPGGAGASVRPAATLMTMRMPPPRWSDLVRHAR